MTKQDVIKIIEQLVQLGEDRDELNYWLDIYDDLPEETQAEVASNLSAELQALQK